MKEYLDECIDDFEVINTKDALHIFNSPDSEIISEDK